MRRVLISLLLLAALAVPATATTPSSGKVSKDTPKVTWTGQVTGFASWQGYNQGQSACNNPSCDTFALEVADGPANLTLRVKSDDSTIFLEVIKPDGSSELFGGASQDVKATLKNAANGAYTLNIAQNESTQGGHEGTAELALASAAPGPSGAPSPAPTPTPAPDQAKPSVSIKVGKVSARKARKISVRLATSSPLKAVQLSLLRGRKTVARAALSELAGSKSLTLRVKGRLKKGTHKLRLLARDSAGRRVTKTVKVRVAR